ncbi:hypothetical protein QM012_009501 [Aureobasidium pullulans]|uniref:Uncharacterized protein n=1 Tax=Aureobasidium pullulans TaxID=5580 RepID=A0ABR0TIE0_AURPU
MSQSKYKNPTIKLLTSKTNKIPQKVINKVLFSAQQEVANLHLGDAFYNHWVLISDPSQQNFSKPTNNVSLDFHSGFLVYTLDSIKEFVDIKLGQDGLGQGEHSHDNLSNDRFGIIDERTAKDNTILYMVEDYIDSFQEAEIRVAWNNATEHDKALVRCFLSEDTEADILFLASSTDDIDHTTGIEEIKDKVYEYLEELRDEEGVTRWFEIRLDAGYTVMAHGGIWLLGAPDTISGRLDFGDDGVMRGPNRTDQSLVGDP